MNVVDSSAWLSYFAGDSNARVFAEPIEALDKLLVPSVTITEVFKSILRQRNEESALEVVAHMEQGTVIALDGELAINAAVFGIELKLPLADSIIYATARKHGALVWTQDADFKALEGVKFYPKARTT
ncbi:MAG: type II toxin-antitoxin system VapC family toxin [Gammaproteobacteria bacterium]|nr:type II toxin-antitoxin system VapC family toxin [Gammaproteobacteria bacterium]